MPSRAWWRKFDDSKERGDQNHLRRACGYPDVTPIRYCGGPLVVACGGGQLRIFTENWRSFDRPHATFPRALGSSLLDGRGLAVIVAISAVISCCFNVADRCR